MRNGNIEIPTERIGAFCAKWKIKASDRSVQGIGVPVVGVRQGERLGHRNDVRRWFDAILAAKQ